ncbi:MAG: hypothetical protein WC637_05460 [Victivallales bacterium]|jgi:SSS family solute:Na+ symporter
MILGLHPLDVAVIVMAFFAVIAVGVWVSRGVKHKTDFFVGGRKLGSVLQFFLNFGTMTDSNGAPMVVTGVYSQGASGMWVPFQPIFSTPFYWFSAVWGRRTRLITGPDQFIERFNSRKLAIAMAWWGIITSILGGGLGNIVSYKVAAAMFVKPESAYNVTEERLIGDYREYQEDSKAFVAGTLPAKKKIRFEELSARYKNGTLPSFISYINPLPFYIIYTLVVMIYILLGGIKAAAYTDAIQGVLILVFSVLMIPVGLAKVGGLSGLHQRVPEHFFNIFGSVQLSDYTWYAIAAFVLMGTITLLGTPGGCGSATDERAMRIGVLGGAFAKRVVMIAWMFCGLLAVAILPGTISDPDNAWGTLAYSLLGPGLLGLMISGILLGHMPGVGAGAVNFSATFTRNLYEPLITGRSEHHYMIVAKLAVVATLALGVVGAMLFSGILTLFTTIVSIGAFFGALGLLMLFWRPLTAMAAGSGWIIWMIFLIVLPWGLPHFQGFQTNPRLTVQTPARTIMVKTPATSDDIAAGRAMKVGEVILRPQVISPVPVYFSSVTRTKPDDPTSTLKGTGRFHIEIYVLSVLGVPVESFKTSGLNCSRWLVDSIGPFLLLMGLTILLPRRHRRHSSAAVVPSEVIDVAKPHEDVSPDEAARIRDMTVNGIVDPASYAAIIMEGNISLLYRPDETIEQEKVRIDRYYAKLKTPVAPTPEADEKELVKTFTDPTRFNKNKLFPKSNWEFNRWTKMDVIGFGSCWLIVFVIMGILWLALNVGKV